MEEQSLKNITDRGTPPALIRWTVLVFISLAMFGNYYIYDSISPLADLLKSQLSFSDSQIGLLNAIYSIPNIIMVIIGGIIIDRIGTKKGTLLFTFLCFLGSLITAIGGSIEVMAAGRLVFGLGAESMIVAVTTALARWFRGTNLGFAFGINLSIARLGSIAALNSPSWATTLYDTWQYPLFLASAAGLVALAAALIYWIIESSAVKTYDLGDAAPTDKIVWTDLFNFGWSFWFIVGLCVTFYSGIFPFQTFAVKMFQEAYGASREFGGFLSSILPITAMILTPMVGLLVDVIGRRALFMTVGSFLLLTAYAILAGIPSSVMVEYAPVSLWVPTIILGISFSLVPAIMWPSVAYIVESNRLGSAYGVMTAIQQVGIAGFNLLIGWANDYSGASADNPEAYRFGLSFFLILGVAGFLFSFLLRRRETGPHGHGLENPKGVSEQKGAAS